MHDIEDLNYEEVYFHFTQSSSVESILKDGLVPRIGNNAKGAEKTEKIFFSKGISGIAHLVNQWIIWKMYRLHAENIRMQLHDRKTNEEFLIAREDFKNGNIPNIEELKEKAIEMMKAEFEKSTYLILDLKEGEDFNRDDVDEIKEKERDRKFIEVMYSKPLNDGDNHMEEWNMHTISGKTVDSSKIFIAQTQGKTDALSIIQKAYELSRTKDESLIYFNEFVEKTMQIRSL